MKLFSYGNLFNKNPIFGVIKFTITFENLIPSIFKAVCFWNLKPRLRYIYIFGFKFVWITKYLKVREVKNANKSKSGK